MWHLSLARTKIKIAKIAVARIVGHEKKPTYGTCSCIQCAHITQVSLYYQVLVDLVSSYVEEARHMVRAKVFRVKVHGYYIVMCFYFLYHFYQMTLKNEKSNKGFDHRETFMLHKLDIQRLTGKKSRSSQHKTLL